MKIRRFFVELITKMEISLLNQREAFNNTLLFFLFIRRPLREPECMWRFPLWADPLAEYCQNSPEKPTMTQDR